MARDKALAKKRASNIQKWGGYDEEAAENELDDIENSKGTSEFDKMKVGKNYRRVMPPPPGTGWGPKGKQSPFLTIYEHIISVPGGERPISFTCPKKHPPVDEDTGKKVKVGCIFCDMAADLKRTGRPKDRDQAFKILPRRRTYANVIDLDADEPEIKVYAFGKTVHEALADLRSDKGDFTHPEEGFEVIIKRKGTGKNDTEYKVTDGDDCPLSEYDFTVDDLYDLEAYIQPPDEDAQDELMEEVERTAFGRSSRKERGSSSRSGRGRSSRRSRGEDDDEDEAPKRRKKRTSRRATDDVVDAEYEEVDDDE